MMKGVRQREVDGIDFRVGEELLVTAVCPRTLCMGLTSLPALVSPI